jgi:hypothetical protein
MAASTGSSMRTNLTIELTDMVYTSGLLEVASLLCLKSVDGSGSSALIG